MDAKKLESHLRQVGRRLLGIGAGAGLGWGLFVAVIALVNCAWLDLLWDMPPAVRVACVTVGLAAIPVILVAATIWALRKKDQRSVARRLDAVGNTGGQVLSGVDLANERAESSLLTAGLANLAVTQASKVALGIRGDQAVPAKPLYRSLAAFLALAAVVAIIVLAAPRLAWTQWRRFTSPYSEQPPYTKLVFQVDPGDAVVPYGNGLDIRVRAEGADVDRLDLVLRPDGASSDEVLPLFREIDGTWHGALAQVIAESHYFIQAREGRSNSFRIHVVTVPRLESVRFRITAPAYTRIAPYEGPLPQGGISGLVGTKVQIWAKSNRPLSGGKCTIAIGKETERVDVKPDGAESSEVAGMFTIRAAGKLELKVTDIDGQDSTDTFTTPINLLTDERPMIRILEPPAVSMATPTASLPIVLSAEDDYGISRIQLFRSLNDSRALAMDVPLPGPQQARRVKTVVLPLAKYGLEPGDEIHLFARVEDNDPAGPKGSESSIVTVRIISQDEFEKMLRTREGMEVLLSKYQQAQRRLEALAEEADRLRKKLAEQKPGSESEAQMRKELNDLAQQMKAEAAAIRAAAAKKLPFDIDKNLTPQLEKMANRAESLSKRTQQLAGRPKLTPQEAAEELQKMMNELQEERQDFEKNALQPLESLAQVQPLMEDAAKFVIIYQRQRSLADRLKALKDEEKATDPSAKARMRDLQSEQETIRNDLAKLLDEIEDHVAALPEDPDLDQLRKEATDFVKLVRESSAGEEMTKAETALADFSGKRAHPASKNAADILEKFIAKCQGANGMSGAGERSLRFKPKLSQCLGNSCEQLLAEAGLTPGSGEEMGGGQGANGGSSAQRNSLNNVGLYGNIPGIGESGGSANSNSGPHGPGRPRNGNRTAAPQSMIGATGSTNTAGTASEAAVPLRYRRRVAEYFQRIIDDSVGK